MKLYKPALWSPDRRIRPPLGSTIDWSHGIAKGLKLAYVCNEQNGQGYELVRNRPLSGSTVKYPDPDFGARSTGTAGAFATNIGDIPTTAPFSVLAQGKLTSTGGYFSFVGFGTYVNETTNTGWGLQSRPGTDSKPGLNFVISNNNGVGTYAFQTTVNTQATGFWDFGATFDGTTRRTYLNGKIDNSGAATMATSLATSVAFDGSGTGGTSLVYIWNRIVSAQEYRLLYANPFLFIKPPRTVPTDVGVALAWHTSLVKTWQ